MRIDQQRLETAYSLLRETVDSGGLQVALLAVADARQTVRCEAFGPPELAKPDAIYPIASITKPIVATCLMQLVEAGQLLIEDPIVQYIPEFAANGKEAVTLWHLLTHTSGMEEGLHTQGATAPTDVEALAAACQASLRWQPGTRFEYCNLAFAVLAEVIGRAGGVPYQRRLRGNLFVPAGMLDTTFAPALSESTRVVPVQSSPDGTEGFVPTCPAAGGLYSTADDLVSFGQTFLPRSNLYGSLLSPMTMGVMTALHTSNIASIADGRQTPEYWGLSWEKAVPREARLLSPTGFGHGGVTGCYLWIDPEAALITVFLTNRLDWDRRARKMILNAVHSALR